MYFATVSIIAIWYNDSDFYDTDIFEKLALGRVIEN